MIQKYIYGDPIETDAVIKEIPTSEGHPSYGTISTQDGFSFTYIMQPEDIVYGLGESNRGINKRGFLYVSNCTDEPNHTEDKQSLYGAHNFIIVDGINHSFGLFVDYPTNLTFDIGYTRQDTPPVPSHHRPLLHPATLCFRLRAEPLGLRKAGGFPQGRFRTPQGSCAT